MQLSLVLTAFLILMVPFVLWQISFIGRTDKMSSRAARAVANVPVRNPQLTWLSINDIVTTLPPPQAGTSNQTGLPSFWVAIQHIEATIKHFLETSSAHHYQGIAVDADDERLRTLTISSDPYTTSCLGAPMVAQHAGPEGSNAVSLSHDPYGDKKAHIFTILVKHWRAQGTLHINGLRIHRLEIDCQVSCTVSVSNCWIDEVRLNRNTSDKKPTLYISSSKLGRLIMEPFCCRNMIFRHVKIRSIICSPPDLGIPIAGSTDFSRDADLCHDDRFLWGEHIQNYRNLRLCLEEIRDSRTAHRVRAIELRAERKYETAIVWLFSSLYDVASDYGNAPQRAATYMITWTVFNFLIVVINGLYVVTSECGGAVAGWIDTLCEPGIIGRVSAAFLLALQPLVNPLGLFRVEQVVLPSTFWLAVWIWVSNVGCLTLLALVGVGIRRSMKD